MLISNFNTKKKKKAQSVHSGGKETEWTFHLQKKKGSVFIKCLMSNVSRLHCVSFLTRTTALSFVRNNETLPLIINIRKKKSATTLTFSTFT